MFLKYDLYPIYVQGILKCGGCDLKFYEKKKKK